MGWPKGVKRGSRPPTAGRKAGTPNKETKALREIILDSLHSYPGGSSAYMQKLMTENQSAYAGLLGKVLPMAVTGADGEGPVIVEILRFGEK
jgi:hypothetical protein